MVDKRYSLENDDAAVFKERRLFPKFILAFAILFLLGAFSYTAYGFYAKHQLATARPPSLIILRPQNGPVQAGSTTLVISGKTDPSYTVHVGGISVSVDKNGYFIVDFALMEGSNAYTVIARNDASKTARLQVAVDYSSGTFVASVPQYKTAGSKTPVTIGTYGSSYDYSYLDSTYKNPSTTKPNNTEPVYTPPVYNPPPPTSSTPADDSAERAYKESQRQYELAVLEAKYSDDLRNLEIWHAQQLQIIDNECSDRNIWESGIRLQMLAALEAEYNRKVPNLNAQYQINVDYINRKYQ
ncbi:MAG: hypothetical protein WC880_04515 [Candidatus Paceibacterota bacterium]